MINKKLILFDCDETLWESLDKDYISSVKSDLKMITGKTILRVADNKRFTLKVGVTKALKFLGKKNDAVIIGVVSDNHPKPVKDALQLFDIWPYINKKAMNIKLWKGYCPKHKIVQKMLSKEEFAQIPLDNVYLFDDKDYSKESEQIGINFIQVNRESDLFELTIKIFGKQAKA